MARYCGFVYCGLVLQALWELVRYDLVLRLCGFGVVHRGVSRLSVRLGSPRADMDTILSAMDLALSLYWRPVRCLQRSVASVRLLRHWGVEASLVIGFRMLPLFGHAWVEIGGRVANDSPAVAGRTENLPERSGSKHVVRLGGSPAGW